MKQFVKNAADESQVRSVEVKEKLAKETLDNDLRFLLSTDQGRRFLWNLIEKTGMFKTSFTGSSQTFFLEGQRNIGLYLVGEIMRVDPEAYIKMYKTK